MANRHQDFISQSRVIARGLWLFTEAIRMQNEWNARDLGTTLEDGLGENAGITRAMVGAVIFDTANAVKTLMDTGHATNVAKLL